MSDLFHENILRKSVRISRNDVKMSQDMFLYFYDGRERNE
jgi:hypothetical protein